MSHGVCVLIIREQALEKQPINKFTIRTVLHVFPEEDYNAIRKEKKRKKKKK